jgi:hypothetical protein
LKISPVLKTLGFVCHHECGIAGIASAVCGINIPDAADALGDWGDHNEISNLCSGTFNSRKHVMIEQMEFVGA